MSHLNINGVDKPLDHIRLNNVRSENLFDCERTEGITIGQYINTTGTISNNQYYYISYPIYVEAGVEYTWRFDNVQEHSAPTVAFYNAGGTQIGVASHASNVTYFTFTTPSDCDFIRASVYTRNDSQKEAMLNLGSTALPYQPYLITKEAWEARTRVILHGLTNPLCGIGTYKDTLDLSTGVLTRYVKKLVLTGEEEVSYEPTYTRFAIILPGSLTVVVRRTPAFCTHYEVIDDGRSIYDVPNNSMYSHNADSRWYIKTTDYSTDDAFKAYLAAQYANGTPVVIWYVLATPETEQITLPSNLTGIVEGYLTQDSTPSPTSPVYPTANGTPEQGGTYSIDTGAYAIAWGRADTFTGTDSISARCYGLPVKSWEIDGNSQQDSGTITIPSQNVTVASVESGTNYAMFLKSDFPDVAVGDKVNIVVSGTTHSLGVKKIDAQYVYIENEVV